MGYLEDLLNALGIGSPKPAPPQTPNPAVAQQVQGLAPNLFPTASTPDTPDLNVSLPNVPDQYTPPQPAVGATGATGDVNNPPPVPQPGFRQPSRGAMDMFIENLPRLALGAVAGLAPRPIPYKGAGGFIGLGALRGLQGAARVGMDILDPAEQAKIAAANAATERAKAEAEYARAHAATAGRMLVSGGQTVLGPDNKLLYTAPLELKRAEIDKIEADKISKEFASAVRAKITKDPKLDLPAAAAQEYEQNIDKYEKLGANHPLVKAATEYRAEGRRLMMDAINNQQRIEAENRRLGAQIGAENRRAGMQLHPGVFVDRQLGDIREVSVAEHAADPKRFKRVGAAEATTFDLLKPAMPIIDAMEKLVPKVLSESKSNQFGTATINALQHKAGVNADLQLLMQLGTVLSVEQARALSGSSRVLGSLFASIRGESVPDFKVTADVARTELRGARQEIQNRLNSIMGVPLQPISTEPIPKPGAKSSPSAPPGARPKKMIYDKAGNLVETQ